MSRVLFASDLHLGHNNIHKFRTEFENSEQHDEFIYDVMLSKITKRDVVWLLGDIAFTKEALNKFKSFSTYDIRIVIGNHDLDQKLSISDWVNAGFTKIYSLIKYKGFWLSHAPLHPDELYGKINIHGHLHKKVIDDRRYISVCPEQTNYNFLLLNDLKLYKV